MASKRVPSDLSIAIEANPTARDHWKGFPPSHRRAYLEWIEEAKKPATRMTRIAKAVTMIAAGKGPK